MSLPEISRRCRSCGAASRAGARFCPQCGEPVADAGGGAPASRPPETREAGTPLDVGAPPAVGPARDVEPSEAESPLEWTPPTREYAAFVQSLEGPRSGAGGAAAGGAQSEHPAAAGARGAASEPTDAAPESQYVRAEDESRRVEEFAPAAATRPYVAAEDGGADGDAGGEAPEGADVDASAGAGDARGRVARVREETRARVGRMREEAIVVLEETPDDAGLRFVVAAVALFVLFLVLLFLSTTVLR